MNKKKRLRRVHVVSPNHPSLKGGFIGMNYEAAKAHRLPWPYPHGDIVIRRGLRKGTRRRTIKHEDIELKLMRGGKQYRTAHKIALKEEKK